MINHKFVSVSAVQIYDLSYIHLHSQPVMFEHVKRGMHKEMDAKRIYFPCFIFYCGVIHRFAFYSRVQIKVIFLFAIFELIGDQFYHFSNVTLIDWN